VAELPFALFRNIKHQWSQNKQVSFGAALWPELSMKCSMCDEQTGFVRPLCTTNWRIRTDMTLRRTLHVALLLITLVALAASYAAAASQTLTGVVSDEMCGKKHTMMPGKPDPDCIRECVKAGSNYALVVGDKVYTLKGDTKKIDPFAGKQVKVTGDVTGTTVAVTSIGEAK
jgi:hypothetical protein